MDQKTYIVGHRGFPHVAPQNTLSSFRAAIAAGADGVETDVQLTKDGEMVIHHDYSIDTTSNGHGRIDTMTFEEVRGYDFGIRRGEQFKGEKIPTFTEFLDTVQVEMATARQFLFTVRVKSTKDKHVFNTANSIENTISREGFEVRRMRKEDIKRFLALYYDASMSGEQMPDIDGEQFYVLPDNE